MFKEKLINLKIIFLGCILLFALLIYKDPFSERTLIPNFEPYPDTFHYINPALSLIKGEGFNINRENRLIKPNVPPLYSLSLIPSFVIRLDPRMSYYSNVILAFISLFLFWSILRKIITNKFIFFSLLILYITNYFIYWVPSIIMAENLTLTLYLAVIFLLLSKPTVLNSVFTAFFIVAVYATKYASIPVSIMSLLMYLLKIFLGQVDIHKKKLLLYFLISLAFFYTLLTVFETMIKGKNFLSQLLIFLDIFYKSIPRKNSISSAVSTSSSWFGVEYVKQNLPIYIRILLGAPSKFLWDSTPIVPSFIGILGSIGIIWNIFHEQYRFICITLLASVFSSVIFMSVFYTYDARYIYIAIPTLIIGFGIFLTSIESRIFKRKRFAFDVLVIVFVTVYLITNFVRIKSQISLNLKYAETPWYYIAVLKMNEYFTKDKIIVDSKKPVLISALPPFLIDYYSNGNYTLLPLSYDQEFRGQETRQIVWGPNDYSNLPKLYTKYLKDGYDVFVSRAGLGNEGYTNRDFNTIVAEFDTKLVQPGCYDQCNIYSVKLKK